MDPGPKLNRQISYGCTPFDLGSWCHSRRVRSAGFVRAFGDGGREEYDEFEPAGRAPAEGAGLRGLWRRIVGEKRRVLRPSSGNHVRGRAAYDEYTYAQNFDEGSPWDDDDNDVLSRSFSARFAAPASWAFQRVR